MTELERIMRERQEALAEAADLRQQLAEWNRSYTELLDRETTCLKQLTASREHEAAGLARERELIEVVKSEYITSCYEKYSPGDAKELHYQCDLCDGNSYPSFSVAAVRHEPDCILAKQPDTGALDAALAAARRAGAEAAAAEVDRAAQAYPTSIFTEPPPGEHGATVDACSAAALRGVLPGIAAAIRNLPLDAAAEGESEKE